MKIILGMSGGVDSSMAAWLLREAGHKVTGVSLKLIDGPDASVGDALEVADRIGIGHMVIDRRDMFRELVVKPFARAYAEGLTPNPCVLCNPRVKFALLFEEAGKQGADLVATGHYAKVEGGVLKKGLDPKKDQSYVLYPLKREWLNRLVFPLGGWRKQDVRKKAQELGMPVFDRPESQEICFVGEGHYGDVVCALAPGACRPGPIVDQEGREVGTHRGIYAYTFGQRKGLGVSSPEPLYVVGIDAGSNTIMVGRREGAMASELIASDLNWLSDMEGDFEGDVKVRSMMQAEPAVVRRLGDDLVRVVFSKPQWAPSPGQSAVFYVSDAVVGGGIIRETTRLG